MRTIFLKLVLVSLLLISNTAYSQYTFGTNIPNPSAVGTFVSADSTKGLVIPIVTTSKRPVASSTIRGMIIYNATTTCMEYCDGVSWTCLDKKIQASKFFYSPSVSVSTSTLGTGFTLDLYAVYTSNFSTPAVKNPNAPSSIPVFDKAELNYYITDFDPAIFSNVSIDDTGVMTYDVISTNPTYCSFVNVVFTIK